jgi:DNA-binding transcriptional ArsR family regulator
MKTITDHGATMKTKQVAKLIDAGKVLARVMDNERWEWQTTHTFLLVCLNGGEMPMQEIEKRLDMGQATVSRNVAKLGPGLTPDEPGARLVEAEEDPYWRRRKIVRLTEKGKRFCEELTAILEK